MAGKLTHGKGGYQAYWFWCPGCETHHAYTIKQPQGHPGPEWEWNGNIECPTFKPSLLCNGSLCRCKAPGCEKQHVDPERGLHRCHLFLTDGQVRYLGDCTHKLAGQTVPVEPARF